MLQSLIQLETAFLFSPCRLCNRGDVAFCHGVCVCVSADEATFLFCVKRFLCLWGGEKKQNSILLSSFTMLTCQGPVGFMLGHFHGEKPTPNPQRGLRQRTR